MSEELTRLDLYWISIVLSVLKRKPFMYSSIRKFIDRQSMVIPGEVWNTGISISFYQMGYRNETSKSNQLRRNYLNKENAIELNDKLKERIDSGKAQTSLSLILNNKEKKISSQGFCMMGLVVNHNEQGIDIDIYYRVTEVIQKYLADLKFLSGEVIPILMDGIDAPLNSVSFTFSNIYASILYLPVVYQFVSPRHILEEVEKTDKLFHGRCISDLRRITKKSHNYTYRSRVLMFDHFKEFGKWHMKDTKDYLKEIDK